MGALSSLSHTSRAVGVLRANDLPPLVAGSPASAVGLHLYGVSDPGNLGTLLRSAQGFGPAHVALAEGCADPLSPRAVRASMGALYSVPVITLARGAAAARDRTGRPRRAHAGRARTRAPRSPSPWAASARPPGRRSRRRRRSRAHPAGRRRRVAERGDRRRAGALRAAPLVDRRAGLTRVAPRRRRRRPGRPADRPAARRSKPDSADDARSGPPRCRARATRRRCATRASSRRPGPGGGRRARGGVRSASQSGSLADALAPRDPAVVRRADVGRARLEDVEDELAALGEQRCRRRVRARRRSASPERCMNVRKGASTRSLGGSGGGSRRSPTTVSSRSPTPRRCARRSRLGEHRGRGVERDHAVAVARELDRDAPAAGAQLDDRPGRALAGEHVERRRRGRRRRTSGRRAARAARRARRPVLLLRVAHAVEWLLRRRRRRVGGRRPEQGAGP